MLFLLIIPVWTLGLVIAAALCFAARSGDEHSLPTREETVAGEARSQLTVLGGDAELHSAPALRELAA